MDVLIDLDGTLVDAHPFFMGNRAGPLKRDEYRVEEYVYSLGYGGREFLLALAGIPDLRLGFFSAGNRYRNSPLVEQIMADVFKGRDIPPYQLYHQEDLTHWGGLYNQVGQKRIKSLRRTPCFDLQNVVIFDDLSGFYAAVGEEKNFIQVVPVETSINPGDKYAWGWTWKATKYRLIRALGLFLLCRNEGLEFLKSLEALQWIDKGRYNYRETYKRSVFERGLVEMQKYNPKLTLNGWSPEPAPVRSLSYYNGFRRAQVKRIIKPSKSVCDDLMKLKL